MIGSSHIAQDKCFKQNNTYKISFFILFLNSFHLCKVWVQLPNVLPYNFLVFLFMFNFFWFSELFIFSSKKSSLFFSLNHFSFHYFLFFLNKFIVQLSISAFFLHWINFFLVSRCKTEGRLIFTFCLSSFHILNVIKNSFLKLILLFSTLKNISGLHLA